MSQVRDRESKLVRDRIPELLRDRGIDPRVHVAGDDEFGQRLIDKLEEELDEYRKSAEPEEPADLLEVIRALAGRHGLAPDELEVLRAKKFQERGAFTRRFVLESATPRSATVGASPLAPLVEYEMWATRQLIEFVRGLTPEQRALALPGTFGPVDRTLAHIVGAALYYVMRLTDEVLGKRDVEAVDPIELDELDLLVSRMLESLSRYLREPMDLDEIRVRGTRRETVGTILAQLLYHGKEHRSQIGVILGAHGIEHPELSGWAWGSSAKP